MATLGVLLLLACVFTPTSALIPTSRERECPFGDYLYNGICCNKCPPGMKLAEKCLREGERSKCTPCPPNQYSDRLNFHPNCKPCKSCNKKKHEVQVSECERERNTLCRCEDGFYIFAIDSETTECLKCTPCGLNEREVQKCTAERNTVCECKENFYRVKRKCEPCKSCAADCKHLCKSLPSHNSGDSEESGNGYIVQVLTGVVVVAMTLLMLLIIYMVTKRFTKKSGLKLPSQISETSAELSEALFQNGDVSVIAVIDCPGSTMLGKANSKLPDCVPLEIKTHDLIYTLLDLVPVTQVKQLVRSLGVTETIIERAELDFRASKEAHYQMLKAWTEMGSQPSGGGGGGRGGMLHSALLQELLLKLRHMHLGGVAEELETKYTIH
ncbi:tumor necrosis factor receptor superfamily member 1A [Syngnathus scovelli]|uniref:tumor necrosis factor receptor superfamily member 1A n=1 Tax=Syngnathus scovelli TaxID=161590 RepID=UPI0021104594|nr:tumor necrosis factor receptor superfamily member 1A [Syngnathus scovelli]XP_049587696.1 tumor necrosis factor receptor superfamily member 1A [Syngnathus scovelli]